MSNVDSSVYAVDLAPDLLQLDVFSSGVSFHERLKKKLVD